MQFSILPDLSHQYRLKCSPGPPKRREKLYVYIINKTAKKSSNFYLSQIKTILSFRLLAGVDTTNHCSSIPQSLFLARQAQWSSQP